ncbi:MAG: N-acetylneuraminic acid mutarotase [Sphingobacteriales bacterium]|jgi:N-acetylneuraminic acid mutarotase
MKHIILASLLVSFSTTVFSQWTTKSNIPAAGRNHPITFSLDGMGYAVTGYNTRGGQFFGESYQYNPAEEAWTKMTNFTGGARGFAAGATYNGKGYLGFGLNNGGYLNDLYEYDPTTDKWKELASCPCLGRRHPAFGITDNGKLYVGLGDGENASGTFIPGFKDMWEYDIATDTWSQQNDLPGIGRHHPYYFTIENDIYMGFGDNHEAIFKDFYKFNSVSQSWTKLNDFPGESRVAGAQFVYNGFGFIVDGEGSDHQNLESGELYKYDPTTDQWTTLSSHIGDGLWAPGAFVIDSMAFVIGGDDNSDVSFNKLWNYSLADKPVDDAISVSSGTVSLNDHFFDQEAQFQWVDCNDNYSKLDGETEGSIQIPTGESYALVVTYSAGGVDTSACYDGTENTTGLDELFADRAFKIYPNPASDFVNIQGPKNFKSELEYSVYNQLGMKLTSGEFKGLDVKLDISNLVNGVYFLTINSEDGVIIKTHAITKM